MTICDEPNFNLENRWFNIQNKIQAHGSKRRLKNFKQNPKIYKRELIQGLADERPDNIKVIQD